MRRMLDWKGFEGLGRFRGGEEEWRSWSWQAKVAIGAMSSELVELIDLAETNSGMNTADLMTLGDPGGLDERYSGCDRGSKELYSFLSRYTEGEAATVVRGVDEMDGVKAFGVLHARYSRRTMGRMFRMQRECMYPKSAKAVGDVAVAVLEWEEKWKRMMGEIGHEAKIPDLWKMSALLEICPKNIQEQMMLRMDEIDEDYEKLKAKILGYVTNKVEQVRQGGPVQMEVDGVWEDAGCGMCYPWGGSEIGCVETPGCPVYGEWSEGIGAVFPGSRCYECGLFGHFARECPKGKGKGKGKDGGKASEKGKGKGGGKEGSKGGWKGGGVKGMGWKGWPPAKAAGKGGMKGAVGKGYQGTCWRCFQVGHKANECGVQLVGEAAEEAAGSAEQVEEAALGVWTVGSVETVEPRRTWRRRVKRESENAGPRGLTLMDFMPKKIEVSNRFRGLVDEEEEELGEDEEVVGEVRDGADPEVVAEAVEVTVDSGASRSVWPRKMKGVVRTKGAAPVKLAAANGTPIQVDGEAALHFKRGKRRCAMKFLDADVKRPLGSVSAMVDGGNRVVFAKGGSYVENEETKERIPMRRKGGVYVMELEAIEMVQEDEARDGAEVGGVKSGGESRGGDGLVFMARLDEKDMGVFRRQA